MNNRLFSFQFTFILMVYHTRKIIVTEIEWYTPDEYKMKAHRYIFFFFFVKETKKKKKNYVFHSMDQKKQKVIERTGTNLYCGAHDKLTLQKEASQPWILVGMHSKSNRAALELVPFLFGVSFSFSIPNSQLIINMGILHGIQQ